LASGGVVAALCYNPPQPPSPTERNPEYAVKLRAVSQRVGLPAEYRWLNSALSLIALFAASFMQWRAADA
jgi:hypothetical protein